MKNSSQTHCCISDPRRKEEQKVKKNGALRKLHPAALFTSPATIHPAARSRFLRFTLFAFVFGFFPIYPCNSLPILVFFVTSLTLNIYISLSLYKLWINHFTFGKRRWAAVSPLLPPFSTFLHFVFHFLSCQTPFDDDKSKDVRLNLSHP